MAGLIDKLRDAKPAKPAWQRNLFARKRSRFLWLKLALAGVALLTGAYLVSWSSFNLSESRITVEQIEPTVATEAGDTKDGGTKVGLAVSGISLEGRSKTDRPFSVSARQALEMAGESDIIELTDPQAEIELSDTTWLAVTAEHGVYYRRDKRVELKGEVTVYNETGWVFRTASASVDLRTNAAEGFEPVLGMDDRREITAEGFQLKDDGKTLIFTGRSRLRISPKHKVDGQ
jgi:lipopolysaccharide export system protein LptC